MSTQDLNTLDVVRYQGDSDWSALYVNGKLVASGDHYLIDEKISEIFRVKEVYSNDFLRGGNRYEDVAPTLDDLHAYRLTREEAEAKAARLREQADELRRQADALLAEAGSK